MTLKDLVCWNARGRDRATPSQMVIRDEMVRALQLGIANLPEDQPEAVLKHRIEERNLDSSADLHEKTDDSVGELVKRAKKSLKDYLRGSTTWFLL